MSKIYPIGIRNFEKIRKEDYVYIDKTPLLYNLIKSGGYYFLGRPRSFDKSLIISTLEYSFEWCKDLFLGFAIDKQENDWTVRPVPHSI